MLEVIRVTDVGGKDLEDILLIDDGGSQDSSNGGDGVRAVLPFGDNVIDFLGSEGGKDRRQGDDEARRVEGILLHAGIKEDGTREHRWFLCDGGVVEGEDQDPLLSGQREGT